MPDNRLLRALGTRSGGRFLLRDRGLR
ncbi:hypothetical protein SCOCK_230131 [Actinacidiphila cocklensis]|uniref:Uncharacterized protein n=1 Tax=Actinacidiphila cocklensis TaxID=887465 RepID=A0A9W4E651_9ACTN|nr:hypothetical protein SCOCK_230131 [Actinacidiphila cocklensis]